MKKLILLLRSSACFAAISPLVEPINENEVNVTLFCKAPDAESVMLMGGLGNHQLERMEDGDMWSGTFLVPKDVRTCYWFSVNGPEMRLDELALDDLDEFRERSIPTWCHDTLNPKTFSFGGEIPTFSVLELEDAPVALWCDPQEEVAKGSIEQFQFTSVRLRNKRTISVYTPPGYDKEKGPYSLVVIFDGSAYTNFVPTPTILDNLIAAEAIPPTIALFVGNTNRDIELPCNTPFAYFVADELIPWMKKHYAITDDPSQTVIAGSSYGALAAAYTALKFPQVFGKVLSQSGAFWWSPKEEPAEWLIRQYELISSKSTEFYLDVGSLETVENFGCPSQLATNRKMLKVLKSKGHNVTYREYSGGHDYICWRVTFADGLINLLSPNLLVPTVNSLGI